MKPLAMYGRVDDSSGYCTLLLKDSKIRSFYIPRLKYKSLSYGFNNYGLPIKSVRLFILIYMSV